MKKILLIFALLLIGLIGYSQITPVSPYGTRIRNNAYIVRGSDTLWFQHDTTGNGRHYIIGSDSISISPVDTIYFADGTKLASAVALPDGITHGQMIYWDADAGAWDTTQVVFYDSLGLILNNTYSIMSWDYAGATEVNMFWLDTANIINHSSMYVKPIITNPNAGEINWVNQQVDSDGDDGDTSSVDLTFNGNSFVKFWGINDGTGTIDTSGVRVDAEVKAERYRSNIVTISADSDAVPVHNCSVLEVNTTGGNVTIGGFTGGETGQILHIIAGDAANNIIIEDDEGTGNQDIKTNTGADVTITADGGYTLIFTGTYWKGTGL